jgi:hypothetical protein
VYYFFLVFQSFFCFHFFLPPFFHPSCIYLFIYFYIPSFFACLLASLFILRLLCLFVFLPSSFLHSEYTFTFFLSSVFFCARNVPWNRPRPYLPKPIRTHHSR